MFQKKQIFKLSILKKLLSDENGCVSLMPSTRLLALPPFFLNDMKSGILYLLNSMLKKYDRSLGGIVIGYQNIKVLMDENTGIIPMGTPEIEVNISVEFYIFQPKIGRLLEGVINKKSNNHIGCLVHKYFNATILKPESVDFDDWICKDLNVDDKIIFKVKELDFTSLLPYIEGVVDENFKHKCSSKNNENSGIGVVNTKGVSFKEELLTSEDSDVELLENTKLKNRNEAEFMTLDVSVNSIVRQTSSQTVTKKEDDNEREYGKERGHCSNKSELSADCDDRGIERSKGFGEKKEKGDGVFGSFISAVHVMKKSDEDKNDTEKDCFSLDKYGQLEDEDSSDFVRPVKAKNEKKNKKMKEKEPLNKTFECLSSKGGDDVFCSTQLEPKSGSKMMIPFCSPIPRGMSSESVDGKSLTWISDVSVMQESRRGTAGKEKEKKKKHKKRRREEEDEVKNVSKKMKISSISFPETGDSNAKMSETDKLVEELCREQINRIGGDLNGLEKTNFKVKKSTKKERKERKKAHNEDSVTRVSEVDGCEETSDKRSTFCELSTRDLSGTKELSAFGKDPAVKKSKEDTCNKSLKVKKNSKVQASEEGSGGDEKKAAGELTDKYNIKGGKQPKTAEVSREGSYDSLHNKALKVKECVVFLEKYKQSTSWPTRESGKMNKKDSELSDLSTGSSKRRHSRKKSNHKEKIKDCLQTRDKYKSGSMFDMAHSPEKLHPDKSLFTDSEQSHSDTDKKRREVNGIEAVSEDKPKIQNELFCNKEATRMKSDKVKKKSKRKVENPDKPKESLYEKLLEQAKRLIDIKGGSPHEKKRKSGSGIKKQSF